jgi:hypothetical protein
MGWRDALAIYGERIRAHVDTAPPLTPAQRARLAVILTSARKASPHAQRRPARTRRQK